MEASKIKAYVLCREHINYFSNAKKELKYNKLSQITDIVNLKQVMKGEYYEKFQENICMCNCYGSNAYNICAFCFCS